MFHLPAEQFEGLVNRLESVKGEWDKVRFGSRVNKVGPTRVEC